MSPESSRPVGGAAVQEAFATVRARGFLVALVALVGIVGGLVYGLSKTTDSSSIARLQLQPLSENGTVISIGVSAPVGPIAADFKSERVLGDLSRATGIDEDELDSELHIIGVPGDPHQMELELPSDGLGIPAQVLFRDWMVAIQSERHSYIDHVLNGTKRSFTEELHQPQRIRSRSELFKNLTRLAGLQGSLKSDVSVLHAPKEVSTASRSPVYYALAGGLIGLLAGTALALGAGLLDRRLRTPAALAAQFGLPVIADLRDGKGAEPLSRRMHASEQSGAGTSPLVIVEAGSLGSALAAAAALEDALDVEVVATGAIASDDAQVAIRGAGSWVLAVSPGKTRADQAAGVATELGGLSSRPLGLVLV